MYFAWDRVAEAAASLTNLDDRFPALFEIRRLFWPAYEALGPTAVVEQGIAGFIDHIFLPNYRLFVQDVECWTKHPVPVLHRRSEQAPVFLDKDLLRACDTLIVISFDTPNSRQQPTETEVMAVREFLAHPDHKVFVCPHHSIGDSQVGPESLEREKAEFQHHGDKAISGRQHFGQFARCLMRNLGIPIENRFGFRPAVTVDGSPMPFIRMSADPGGLLTGVTTLNTHPHLPHFERQDASVELLDVLASQYIDRTAPPHPSAGQNRVFDSILQSRTGLFEGTVVVADPTLWTSAFGAVNELKVLWRNLALGVGSDWRRA